MAQQSCAIVQDIKHYGCSGALNEALEKYPHPEIFNTDQGVNTPVKCIPKGLKNWVLLYLWMVKVEQQVISALSASGEAPKFKEMNESMLNLHIKECDFLEKSRFELL